MRFLLAALVVVAPAARVGAQPAEEGKPALVVETGGHSATIGNVLITPAGKELITVSLDKTARIWEVNSGRLLRTIRPPQGVGDAGELWGAALSADGKLLAVGGRVFPKAKVCPIFLIDVPTGRLVRTIDCPIVSVRCLALSGATLAVGTTQGKVLLFNSETGAAGKKLDGHKGGTTQVVFSPKGNQLASVGYDKVGRVWSVATGKQTAVLKTEDKLVVVRTIAWGPNGKSIAAGLAEETRTSSPYFGVWRPDGTLVRKMDHPDRQPAYIHSLVFTPDSEAIVDAGISGNHAFAVLLDAATGARRQTYYHQNYNNEEVPSAPVAVSPDGRFVAAAGDRNHRTFLYTLNGKPLRTLGGRGRRITDVAWVKGETQPLQVVWRTGLLTDKVRDLKPGELHEDYFQYALNVEDMQARRIPPGPYHLRQSEREDVKLVWARAELKVERPGQPAQIIRPFGTDEDWVQRRAYTLVTPGLAVLAKRNGLTVHDTRDGKQLRVLLGPNGVTRTVAPSPDNKLVAAGGDDQVLRLWDPHGKEPLLSVYATGGAWVAWTPAGYYTASAGGERLVGWHVNNSLDKLASFYPLGRFSKRFHRPDVIALVLKKGSVHEAVKAADAALGKQTRSAAIAQLLPPKVTIVVDDSKGPEVTVTAEAVAGAAEQPVTSLRLCLDGRPFPDPKAMTNFGAGQAKARAVWTVTVPAGDHLLSVQARSQDAAAHSEPFAVKGAAPVQAPTLHVLAVGINDYQIRALRLKLAADDAKELAEAFPKHCKGPLFGDVRATSLLDAQAHKKAILEQLKAIKDKATENDLFVFTFAGHGVKDKDQFYLLPVEANVFDLANTALSGDELRRAVVDFKCQVVLVLDACHSAGFGEGRTLTKAGLRPATDDATRTLTDDDVGVVVFCAAMGHEKAIEMKQHGLFTQALLEALEGGPGVPRHAFNKQIYIHHVYSYIFDQVSGISRDRQHPLLNTPWTVESFPLR